MPFAAPWMDLEIIILSEVNQTETNIISFIEGILKKWYKWTYLQNRNRLTDIENKPEERVVGVNKGFRINICTLLFIYK